MSEVSTRSEHTQTPSPEFDGGAFTISAFSPSIEGFTFQTRQSIRRKDEPNPELFKQSEKEKLKNAMQDEMKFNNADEVTTAREALKTAITEQINRHTLSLPRLDEEKRDKEDDSNLYLSRFRKAMEDEAFAANVDENLIKLYTDLEEKRKAYMQKGKKIGMRNIAVDGNTITADVKLVSFQMYNEFSNPGISDELLDMSSLAGMAMVIRSADGRLIIQHRAIAKRRLHEAKMTRGNASYTDIPGTSVGGLVDASLQFSDRKPGTPDPIDTHSINKQILKETGEELGLDDSDVERLRIVGLAHDKVKIHESLLFFAESKLTAKQIELRSRNSKRNKNLGDADFEEKFVDIEASPHAVETLLTKVKCPLPADHVAAFVAAGYSMVLQEQGFAAANEWKQQLEKGVKDNYQEINQTVTDYYKKHPEVLHQVPERFWGKNIPQRRRQEYTPAYGPEEQGLPSFEDEMTRTGLIPETRRHVEEGLMLDVDGTITDPLEKRVKYDELIRELADRLTMEEPVSLNTGRSTTWVLKHVVSRIKEQLADSSLLKNLVVVGEKGGTWVTFTDDGKAQHGKVASIEIPNTLYKKVQELVKEKYNDSMSLLESGEEEQTKETMISLEMKDGYDLADFHLKQRELIGELEKILEETETAGTFKIDPTTIATDIESLNVGKALGTDRCLQWLRDKGIKIKKCVAFGDSVRDIEMANELQRRGREVEFVYVGDPKKLKEAEDQGKIKDKSIIKNVGGYTQGTLKYLKKETSNL